MEVIARVLALALAFALVGARTEAAPPGPGPAKPTPAGADAEARRRFDRALELYKDGALDAALVELERAYALRPVSKLLYNLAVVRRDLRRYADALETFEAYQTEAGPSLDRARRAEVAREIEKLRGFVGALAIEVSEAGAEIAVDDRPVGISPLPGRVRVNVGQRRVTAARGGRQAATVIAVAGGDEATVSLKLPRPVAPTLAAPARPSVAPSSPPPSRLRPWIAAGVTAVLVIAATATGVLALGARDDVESARFVGTTPDGPTRALESRASSLALATDLLFAGAAVSGGVTLWLLVRTPGSEPTRAAGLGAGVHWTF